MSESNTQDLEKQAKAIAQQVPCRSCGCMTLRAWVQESHSKRLGITFAPPVIYVDCDNPHCKLYRVTRAIFNWLAMDLSDWNAKPYADFDQEMNLRHLVESCIRQYEAPFADLVLGDFHDHLRATPPHARRTIADQWYGMYRRRF